MPEFIDRDAVARFLFERYGSSVQSVAELGGGDWSRAFSFRLDTRGGRDLVVRLGRYREDFIRDQKAAAFAGPELPIPMVLDVGEVPALGCFYAISERCFGLFLETLDAHQWQSLLPSLLRALDTLREIPTQGGGIQWASDGGSAPAQAWQEWLLASLEDHPGGRVSGWRDKLKQTPALEALFVRGENTLRSLLGVCPNIRHVLHRDLLNRNVLVAPDASRLEGVFDWGCSLAGDFLYEVAWLTFWAPWYPALEALDFCRAVVAHYETIGLAVENFDHRLTAYELQIGLEHIAYAVFTSRDEDLRAVAERTRQILGGLAPGL